MARWEWKCKLCGDVKISDSKERHTLDYCKCKKSGVDLEEGYARIIGKDTVEIIERFIY